MRRALSSTLAVSFASVFAAGSAHAFTEDICYPSDGGIAECTPLPDMCLPAGTDTPACRTAAAALFATSNMRYPDARSTVHVDTPYIMAQVAGFSATDAYWIAAYSEATDRGSFEPRDETGAVVGGGSLATASVPGLQRTDLTSGGVLIHFGAPRNTAAPQAVPGIDGLNPDPTNAGTEVILANLRAWAMAGSGPSHPDCAGGITNSSAAGDNATGAGCYTNDGGSATISGAILLVDGLRDPPPDAGLITFSLPTGLQVIQDADGGVVTSDQFDTLVGGGPDRIADARLGVYLHSYGDRISHHVCLDQAYLYGPTDQGSSWESNMTNDQCAQGIHALRHMWETGVDFAMLRPEDRTTVAYLGNLYDELVAFAKARGVFGADASDPALRAALIEQLTAALSTHDVSARLAALRAITCERGLTAFPGETACPASSDAGADAGALLADASANADTGASAPAAAANGDHPESSGGCSMVPGADSGSAGYAVFVTMAAVFFRLLGRRGSRPRRPPTATRPENAELPA